MSDTPAREPALALHLPPDELALLDDWRRRQPDRPSRSEAVRRLVTESLRAGRRGGTGYIEAENLSSENDG